MTLATSVVLVLRDRADSYWRDAAELDKEGDTVMAIAYWAIASELRKLAGQFNEPSNGL